MPLLIGSWGRRNAHRRQRSGQAETALHAWRLYGKSRHKAGLNLEDCAAYALAKISNELLLFKGKDFTETDITAVGDASS